MPAKGKYLLREKAEQEMVKAESLIGEPLARHIGDQTVAHKDTIVRRRQPGRCAMCGSTRHYTSQCTRPVRPKAKNDEWADNAWQQEDAEWQESTWETEEYEASKGKKGKGKRSKSKGKSKKKGQPRSITPRPSFPINLLEATDPNPKPNLKPAPA